MKSRLLYAEIEKYIDHKNALVLTGLRQVGKTTLMKKLFDSFSGPKIWFDLDNPLDQKFFEEEDYNAIYHKLTINLGSQNRRILVCIDEIQNFPEITRIVKYLIDHYAVKFILTGSSNFYLKNLFPESLSGRKFHFQLNPLTFSEFLYFNDQLPPDKMISAEINTQLKLNDYIQYTKRSLWFDQYMEYGGFPEVVLTNDIDTKKLVLKNIFASFFEKDLRILSDYKDVKELRDLILLLIPRTGTLLDITKLSGELGIDRPKTYSYLEFLSGIFFITLLPKFSKSIDKSVAGGRKVYFADTGILNLLGKIPEGILFENTVINQLKSYGNISFYNFHNKVEIDAILDNRIAFEIKTAPSAADLKHLEKTSLKIGIPEYAILGKNYTTQVPVSYPLFL